MVTVWVRRVSLLRARHTVTRGPHAICVFMCIHPLTALICLLDSLEHLSGRSAMCTPPMRMRPHMVQLIHQHFSVPGALFSQINLYGKNMFQLHLLGKHRNLALSCGSFTFQICTKINIPGQHSGVHMNFILKSHVLGRAH